MKKTVQPDESKGNVKYIQQCIDAIKGAGGGELLLKRGTHNSGPLRLCSNLHIHFEDGAGLFFSDNVDLYSPVHTRWEGTECYAVSPLMFADRCSEVSLSGKGIIDGRGETWWKYYRELRAGQNPAEIRPLRNVIGKLNQYVSAGSGGGGIETHFLRPPLLQFKDCKGVTVQDVTLQNSPFWNTHILYSEDVRLERVHFKNPANSPNTDGLDIDSSVLVSVLNCVFDVGDDCLCIKSGMDEDGRRVNRPSENIRIDGCIMNKGHGGVVFGSESASLIRNVTVSNCVMKGTDRGIRVKTRRGRGGRIEDLYIDNVTMSDVMCPITVNMYYRCGLGEEKIEELKTLHPLPVDEKTPQIQNIRISNLVCSDVSACAAYFCGLPERPVTGIKLQNIEMSMRQNPSEGEPAMDMFYSKVAGKGILCRFIESPQLDNIKISGLKGSDIENYDN